MSLLQVLIAIVFLALLVPVVLYVRRSAKETAEAIVWVLDQKYKQRTNIKAKE